MGKFKSKKVRNDPLLAQLSEDKSVRQNPRKKDSQRSGVVTEQNPEEYVESKLSKKILEQARLQQVELEEQYGTTVKPTKSTSFSATVQLDSNSEASDTEERSTFEEQAVQIDPADEEQMNQFMSSDPMKRRTLADIIQEKLTEKRTEIQSQMSDATNVKDLDERLVEMYRKVGLVLRKYRSGKIPKAFKVVPTLSNWEQILYIMQPESWSAASIYQATRIFSSSLNTKMAQRFINLILLPRVRDDIAEYRKLNFHLYTAVSKALYKPAAFFKGFLLPLCDSGTCTLQEAVIIAGILHKASIPMLHSAAAILKLAEMKYNGACSVFLRTLLDKKYALPYRVIDAVVYHFLGFKNDDRALPVLWHQCFLVFVQRYKEDMSSEQKESLYELLRKHCHEKITPEIRREIANSKCRDVELSQPSNMGSMEMC
ncbi:bystin-like [Watersipora subatra]|uniref:bystin-like n=1 Tax=Watersipora subatra TaxID=2589382 RepID=UPI00355BAC0B